MGKLSKSKDFYPGTQERVCLIRGQRSVQNNKNHDNNNINNINKINNCEDGSSSQENSNNFHKTLRPLAVNNVIQFIINKVLEFPLPKEMMMQNSNFAERARQVKIIVPNSTAGLIIGKKGVTIKQIAEIRGAKIQMTQKPDSRSQMHMQPLLERVITICGENKEQLFQAVDLILEKIREDPQSGSCPNLSYQNVAGLIANANPVGSPYAPVNETQLQIAANGLTLASTSLLKFSVNQSQAGAAGLQGTAVSVAPHLNFGGISQNHQQNQNQHHHHHQNTNHPSQQHHINNTTAQLMNFNTLTSHNPSLPMNVHLAATNHHLPAVSLHNVGLTVNSHRFGIPLVNLNPGRPAASAAAVVASSAQNTTTTHHHNNNQNHASTNQRIKPNQDQNNNNDQANNNNNGQIIVQNQAAELTG